MTGREKGGSGSSSGSTNGGRGNEFSPGTGQADDDAIVPDQTCGPSTPPTTDFPFSGTIVVDEYSPSILSPEYEGIVEIQPTPLQKIRFSTAAFPVATRRLNDVPPAL